MKQTRRAVLGAMLGSVLVLAASVNAHADDKKITLGFAQVGAESAWRTANTVSVKSAAKDAGINLKFSDAQQKQENQIKAIRSYIAQKVDVIAFSPVVESGWEPILIEAKNAKIPVILTDRNIDVKDKSLYVTMIGSDFLEEAGAAASGWKNATRTRRGRSTSSSCRARWDRRRRTTGERVCSKSSRTIPSSR